MSEVQLQARHQQRVEELCAAAIRALSGQADLHFRGRRLHRARTALPLYAPHLHPDADKDDFITFRGAADGFALRLTRSDAEVHRRLAPADPVQRLVFDLLEQTRVESLADPAMPGVARNLAHSFEQWSLAFVDAGLAESARGILLYCVTQMCRARVHAAPVPHAIEDLLETTRGGLAPMIGEDMAALRRLRFDQSAYAVHALAIAQQVAEMVESAADEDDGGTRNPDDGEDIERAAFSLVMQVGKDMPEAMASVVSGRSLVFEGADNDYRVFTKAYDREVKALDLARIAVLQEYRAQLDQRIAAQRINLPRLARALKSLLARPQRDGWDSAQEEGLIDGRRLAQLINSPTERRLFKQEHHEPLADSIVSILIDCSGSMREHAQPVAMLADILVRALEMAGVPSEVLGFTTGGWNGGRAQRDWVRAGRPGHPGRLNELCHIVFKDARTSWRSGRTGMGALLKGDLFRESIDGEALDWACTRLAGREEGRKLLIVVSDGCPMDGATQLANDTFYLDNHLKQVVQRHEQRAEVEICALGVGLDLSPYYSHCQALDLSVPPGNNVFGEIISLLGRRTRR
jgi:cobaltochelatase CobT